MVMARGGAVWGSRELYVCRCGKKGVYENYLYPLGKFVTRCRYCGRTAEGTIGNFKKAFFPIDKLEKQTRVKP